jgi:exo-1,4-beta-D-glucosaminidase
MGLWQDVEVRTSGPVALGRAFVATDLPLPALAPARVTVETEARNATDRPVSGVLSGRIEGVSFSQRVTLAARESRKVTFAPEAFPQLILEHPRLWWPWQLGKPELYGLDLVFSMDHVASDHAVSDRASVSFGIRHVDSRLRDGHALYSVNGVDVLVLGGGYAPDLLQRRALPGRPDWQEDQIRYVRDMGLNTVRLEGKLEDDAFYDLCDRYGILVMAG